MKGHIRERSPGHWAIVIDLRDPATGKRKRKWHSFKGNKRQSARVISPSRAMSRMTQAAQNVVALRLPSWAWAAAVMRPRRRF
jgi:hypothetical protein